MNLLAIGIIVLGCLYSVGRFFQTRNPGFLVFLGFWIYLSSSFVHGNSPSFIVAFTLIPVAMIGRRIWERKMGVVSWPEFWEWLQTAARYIVSLPLVLLLVICSRFFPKGLDLLFHILGRAGKMAARISGIAHYRHPADLDAQTYLGYEYPSSRHGDPFDPAANGVFFGYLTNRGKPFTRLSDRMDDFGEENQALYQTVPMGYTNLLILRRLSWCDRQGNIHQFPGPSEDGAASRNGAGKKETEKRYAVIGPLSGIISRHQNPETAIAGAKQAVGTTAEPILLACEIVGEYFWH